MSKGNVDKFLGLMQKDEGLARKMAACLYKLETNEGKAEGSGDFISREIVPLAKEYGLEFTAQDFFDYTEEAKAKVGLSDDDLAEVSGGKGGVRAALMGTLALVGVASAPAAVKLASGGEVAPFSMVASAAEPATQEQQDEMKLYTAILQALQQPLDVSKQLEQHNKVTLENKRSSAVQGLQRMHTGHLDFDAGKLSAAKQVIDEIYNSGVSCRTLDSLKTIENFELKISQLSKAAIDTTALKNQLEGLKVQLKTILASKAGAAKNGERETFDKKASSLETSINKAKDILELTEKLNINKNKEQLVQNLHNIKSKLSYNEGTKIDEQIAALNNEIKDFTPENIAQKEADFNAINEFTDAIIKVNNLQKEVDNLLKTKGANQNILNDIKGALDIAARYLTKENAADISKVLTEIKEKLKAEKENIEKIKAESKEKKQKEQEEKDKKANAVDFFNDTNTKAKSTLPKLKDRLDGLETFVVEVQKRTDAASVQEAINRLRARIDSFGDVTYEHANEKANELENIEKEIESLVDDVYGFEENLSTHVKKPKNNIGKMLTFYKNEAKDQAAVEEIEKLEQKLAAISEQPTDALELSRVATIIGNIKVSIPQINKATTLKKIAEQVDDRFTEIFDKIIKEIEAADSVENVKKAEIDIDNAEKTLRGLMRTKINEANKTAHILHEIAKIFGLNQLKGNFLNLIDTFDRFNYAAAPIAELYKVYQDVETVNIAENELKNYLGEQIDNLAKQANELKDQAKGVDDDLKKSFEDTATNLQTEKENLLKNLAHAAKIVSVVRESLAERQRDLMPKLALKKQIDDLKEQATKLKDMAAGVSEDHIIMFSKILIYLDKKLNVTQLEKIKQDLDACAKTFIEKLKLSEEIDELLENEVMGTEIQDELKAIKAGLQKADEANADTVVKAFDDVKAVKTKMANKLLEWHKILSDYHNKDYHKEGVETEVVKINLDQLHNLTNQMLNGADGIKLDAETLNTATALAKELAGNLKMDIADVKGYKGFHRADYTAAVQANTLATFLKDKVGNASNLKFVDKQTRAKLAKDIKHIFDQIKIDRETGKYYLPGFYNQLGAVNHDDLKLICKAYDVVAEDIGERSSYASYNELSKEGTNLEKATYLSRTLHEVQRLDLLDVSPESREALKKYIMEIGAKIKSTPGWIYGQTLSLDGVDKKEIKNMQSGLAKILEFYNYLKVQK